MGWISTHCAQTSDLDPCLIWEQGVKLVMPLRHMCGPLLQADTQKRNYIKLRTAAMPEDFREGESAKRNTCRKELCEKHEEFSGVKGDLSITFCICTCVCVCL